MTAESDDEILAAIEAARSPVSPADTDDHDDAALALAAAGAAPPATVVADETVEEKAEAAAVQGVESGASREAVKAMLSVFTAELSEERVDEIIEEAFSHHLAGAVPAPAAPVPPPGTPPTVATQVNWLIRFCKKLLGYWPVLAAIAVVLLLFYSLCLAVGGAAQSKLGLTIGNFRYKGTIFTLIMQLAALVGLGALGYYWVRRRQAKRAVAQTAAPVTPAATT